MKTVKTEDLDMEKELPTKRDHAIPGVIKRDTAANIEGGKQVSVETSKVLAILNACF